MKAKLILALCCFAALAGHLTAAERVELNTGKTGAPISKYIYGQFIEHLGRCIYGGIWAEMLEDRKFYYPITDDFNPWAMGEDAFWASGPFRYLNGSPWRVIGPLGTIRMDNRYAFVGEHSAVVSLPGGGVMAGIAQDGLAVVKDAGYTGRVILAGDPSAAPILARLVAGEGKVLTQEIKGAGEEFAAFPLKFTAPWSSDQVTLEIVSRGTGSFRIGTVSLMPADNVKGWRKDVLALLKELNAPVYRWPGGNFVSGYNWKDGIGERDRRPPRKNPAWKGVEPNDVGIDEFMELMQLLGAEPYIAVNTGLGTVEEVGEEVEYCNGAATTPMGRARAQGGHPAPYDVRWWAVGNEMYGSWQLGHMPLEEYVKKHNLVAEEMRRIDSNVKLVGVGAVGPWSETMLKLCSDHMTLLSEHIYCKEKPDPAEHARQLSDEIRRVAEAHRKYRREAPELQGKDVRIAMDEWNFWYGPYIYGELGVQYHLKDALGVALAFHEYFRNSDLYFMANYAQTVNVIGAIKTSRTASCLDTTGVALELYRAQFGEVPIETSGAPDGMDIAAAWTADKRAVTLSVVNLRRTAEQVALDAGAVRFKSKAKSWVITGADPQACNEPGKPPGVVVKEAKVAIKDGAISVPPFSVSLFRLEVD
jgi:alpha-N-arabinofuranosidase